MDWEMIIKKEFQALQIEKEKETNQFRNNNKETVYSRNKETHCATWMNTENEKGFQFETGEAIKSLFYGEDRQIINNNVDAFMLPKVSRPPPMTMWVSIPRNFVSKDSEELQSIPYLGDDIMDDSFVNDLISTYNGNMPGAKTDSIDDEMFVNLVRKLIPYQKRTTSMVQASSAQATDACDSNAPNVEQVSDPDPIIFERISSFFNGNYTAEKYVKLTKSDSKSATCTPNIDEPMEVALDPDESLHAYRKLLCRRCCIYGCQLHSRSENTDGENFRKNNVEELKTFAEPCSSTCYLKTKESEDVIEGENGVAITETVIQNAAAVSEETDADKVTYDETDLSDIFPIPFDSTANAVSSFDEFLLDVSVLTQSIFDDIIIDGVRTESENTITEMHEATNSEDEWSCSDQTLFLVLLKVFPYNCCAIAEAMRKSCEQVFRKMQSTGEVTNRRRLDIEKSKKERPKTYGDLQQHLSKTYSPCNHQEPCNKTSDCLCLCCEKYCSCGTDCRKRSPKCACKGACMASKCVCYSGHRECDPEICECTGCRNVGIQFGHGKKLQVVASTIHGWGVAVTETCQKSDFVAEYKGEIISTEECERRGKVYDKKQCTYMFSLNGDTLIDSMRFGNNIRFANFSKDPNCYCRVMMVNGDHRIGVYASRAIVAGEELTIDYCTHDPTKTKEN